VVTPGLAGLANSGPHGFSEALYAYVSATGNNGSAFAGLSANTPFWNTTLGLAMWIGRFLLIVPMLAVAGSLAGKKLVPASAGTLPDGWRAFRRSSDRRDLDHGRPYLLSRSGAWPDRGASRDARRRPLLTAAEHCRCGVDARSLSGNMAKTKMFPVKHFW
jgi:hypothetical protein